MKVPTALFLACTLAAATYATADVTAPVPIPDRLKGADRVVVASVGEISATYETNQYGDRLIVSHITLTVEEALKGRKEPSLPMDMDGGTVGGITLEVSSLPSLKRGDRAVFFLKQNGAGKFVPHLRGQGILKLEHDNRIKDSSLTLQMIREMAAAAGR
jgi:hypothetical protein